MATHKCKLNKNGRCFEDPRTIWIWSFQNIQQSLNIVLIAVKTIGIMNFVNGMFSSKENPQLQTTD